MNKYEEKHKFEEYVEKVNAGNYPTDPLVPPCSRHDSDAGTIFNLAHGAFGHVALIRTFAGHLRSNHFHLTDWHFIHLLSGHMHYWWRIKGLDDELKCVVAKPGQTIFTPPLTDHATFFSADSTVVAISKNARTPKEHETDTRRVPIVGDRCDLSQFKHVMTAQEQRLPSITECDMDSVHLLWCNAYRDGIPIFSCKNHRTFAAKFLTHLNNTSSTKEIVEEFCIR